MRVFENERGKRNPVSQIIVHWLSEVGRQPRPAPPCEIHAHTGRKPAFAWSGGASGPAWFDASLSMNKTDTRKISPESGHVLFDSLGFALPASPSNFGASSSVALRLWRTQEVKR